jgi:hypothetical protein
VKASFDAGGAASISTSEGWRSARAKFHRAANRRPSLALRAESIFAFALILLANVTLVAAPPKVTSLAPTGVQLGTESVFTASGEFSSWPVEAWCDRAGVTIKAEGDKGKFRITAGKEVVPGVGWVRFYNAEGASSLRPLFLDQLPEVEEQEPNDAPEKPQAVASQTIVTGKLAKNGDVDAFLVELKQGETLVASLRAHSILASPMDAVLQICELRERKISSAAGIAPQVEAFVLEQNNDAVGLDPQLSAVAPRAGKYLVRVFAFPSEPDSGINFHGGDNYVYRLTITTGGLVEAALPIAGQANAAQLFGPGLPVEGIAGKLAPGVGFAPGIAGTAVWPEGASAAAQDKLPDGNATLIGRLPNAGAVQSWKFAAQKGDKRSFRIRSRSLGFPLDGVLTLTDPAGKVLQQVDDLNKDPDPTLAFNAATEGEHSLSLRDLHRRGGPRFVYWLESLTQPRFELALAADAFTVGQGKTVEVTVNIDRQANHARPIKLKAVALGGGDLPAGITYAEVAADGSAKMAKLVIAAAADASPGGFPITIVGSDESGASVTAKVNIAAPLAVPPAAAWLTVTK